MKILKMYKGTKLRPWSFLNIGVEMEAVNCKCNEQIGKANLQKHNPCNEAYFLKLKIELFYFSARSNWSENRKSMVPKEQRFILAKT